ncbi:hypothetical protein KP001_01400 [Geomonas subterranea]|uniref:DUF2178 domain-containing protein n=1 Tax=Geomonas subterranea TaxID=2847989 RepID=A0ABX8LKK0_9BACT|nr:hypothetical protein [Geomonas subterranea]QXE91225.1 hypothetical protein KP001_01400 [Geomonas subterranea]QXM10688.1 hypothetical protein KP002_06090 [Geomonas subterranea]
MNRRETYLMGLAMLFFSGSIALCAAWISGIINPLFKDFPKEQIIINVVIYFTPYLVLLGNLQSGMKLHRIKSIEKGHKNAFNAYVSGTLISYAVYIAAFVVPVKSFAGGAAIIDGIWIFFSIAVTAALMWPAFKYKNIEI